MRRRVAALVALALVAVAVAGAVWGSGRGDDAAAARAAFGDPVGGMQFDSHDLAGLGVPLRRVSFRVTWRTRSLATGLLAVPPGRRDRMPAVLYVHGLGADASDFAPEALLMASRGAVTLCLDTADVHAPQPPRRGVRALEADLALRRRTVAMIRAALAQLAARDGVDPTRIALVGFSRGAAVAALAATEMERLAAEVYVSGGAGLSTWPGELGRVSPRSRARVARMRAQIDPANALAAATAARPRLVQLGTADDVIALPDLERFAAAVRLPRRLERLRGLNHPLDLDALRRRLDWLTSHLDVDGPPVAGAPSAPPTTAP